MFLEVLIVESDFSGPFANGAILESISLSGLLDPHIKFIHQDKLFLA